MAGGGETRRKVTIREVARAAGVAVSTASVAFNRPESVRPATRARVLEAARALGYQPDAVARRLASRRSRTVAAVVPGLANPFYATIVEEIQVAAHTAGLDLILYDSRGRPDLEAVHIDSLVRNRVEGVVFAGEHTGPGGPHDRRIRELAAGGMAVVLVERALSDSTVPCIYADKEEGARKAVSHLLGLGHRRIAMVAGRLDIGGSHYRLKGYRAALEAAGVDFSPELVADGFFTPLGGYLATRDLLNRCPGFTAVFVANDLMAIGVLKALAEAGRQVPRDTSVVGFDNIPESRFLTPALSTVELPMAAIGRLAGKVLLQLLAGQEVRPATMVMPVELVLRDSTAPAPGSA